MIAFARLTAILFVFLALSLAFVAPVAMSEGAGNSPGTQSAPSPLDSLATPATDLEKALFEKYKSDPDAIKGFLATRNFLRAVDANPKNASRIPIEVDIKYTVSKAERTVIFDALIDEAADTAADVMVETTRLHVPVLRGDINAVRSALDQGADVNEINIALGSTPLHEAAYNGCVEIARLLIEKGAHVNAKDYSGKTPLDLARERGFFEIVEILQKKAGE